MDFLKGETRRVIARRWNFRNSDFSLYRFRLYEFLSHLEHTQEVYFVVSDPLNSTTLIENCWIDLFQYEVLDLSDFNHWTEYFDIIF